MDQKEILKQMMQFNKSAVENSFNALSIVQEQNEKIISTFLDQASWVPEDGRKGIKDWSEMYKKGYTDFKKMIDDYYQKVEGYLSGE